MAGNFVLWDYGEWWKGIQTVQISPIGDSIGYTTHAKGKTRTIEPGCKRKPAGWLDHPEKADKVSALLNDHGLIRVVRSHSLFWGPWISTMILHRNTWTEMDPETHQIFHGFKLHGKDEPVNSESQRSNCTLMCRMTSCRAINLQFTSIYSVSPSRLWHQLGKAFYIHFHTIMLL